MNKAEIVFNLPAAGVNRMELIALCDLSVDVLEAQARKIFNTECDIFGNIAPLLRVDILMERIAELVEPKHLNVIREALMVNSNADISMYFVVK